MTHYAKSTPLSDKEHIKLEVSYDQEFKTYVLTVTHPFRHAHPDTTHHRSISKLRRYLPIYGLPASTPLPQLLIEMGATIIYLLPFTNQCITPDMTREIESEDQ